MKHPILKTNPPPPPWPDFYAIRQKLEETLGQADALHQSSPLAWCDSPLEVLIATVLTQATADRNALQAWREFRKAYPDLHDVLSANEAELATVIRSAGLAEQKAGTIMAALRDIQKHFGELSLERLKQNQLNQNPESAMRFLTSLPGIGPKTAACTVLFGLGIPGFPVDTHIDRIIKRLGWVPSKINPAKAQEILTQAIPSGLHSPLHILLLNLGRQYCRPTNPLCSQCPMGQECEGNDSKKPQA